LKLGINLYFVTNLYSMLTRCTILSALLLAFHTFSTSAQSVTDTIFFDDQWHECSRNNAAYFRFIDKQLNGKYNVRDHYLDGHMQMEGTYRDSALKVRDGSFIYYWPNGKKMSESSYVYDFPDGAWKRWFANGALFEESFYVRGRREGSLKLYDSASGYLLSKEEYIHGQRDGRLEEYFRGSHRLRYVATFKYGWLNGWAAHYDSATGRKLDEGSYKNNERDGVWHYYPWEGHTWSALQPDKHVYFTYREDELEGPATYFFTSGVKAEEGNMHHGKRSGLWRRYYEDGTLRYAAHCLAGSREGAAVYYDESGYKVREGIFKNNNEYGVWTFYRDESNSIDHTSTYDKNGTENGLYVMYDEATGNKIAWGNVVNGQYHGAWTIVYPATGDTEMVKTYDRNHLDGYICYYDPETHYKTVDGWYKDDQKDGAWYRWYPRRPDTIAVEIYRRDGNVLIKKYDSVHHRLLEQGLITSTGQKDSAWVAYFTDGRVRAISTYTNGENSGSYKSFDSASGKLIESGYWLGGVKAGAWKIWYPGTTKLQSVVNYKDGGLEGKATYYYINGKVKGEGKFESDARTGLWHFYDPASGAVMEEVTYLHGQKHGKDKFYINGKLDHVDQYANGEKLTP
jgi:antitoxin component YwqK of YwqJK toxin-antitoxin module